MDLLTDPTAIASLILKVSSLDRNTLSTQTFSTGALAPPLITSQLTVKGFPDNPEAGTVTFSTARFAGGVIVTLMILLLCELFTFDNSSTLFSTSESK
ncbi:hypothetical protein MYP_5009 [Sporocytophaga myxococcoides]|uniref:Uncharacterized protein n=1 Tax=Sporocytophaga myxococcoides TaxID=153721 RepID=A0A098LP20_9BACT|nr:hypothetical protein MYP_5009 [Sporocytophaga myxococcoides]